MNVGVVKMNCRASTLYNSGLNASKAKIEKLAAAILTLAPGRMVPFRSSPSSLEMLSKTSIVRREQNSDDAHLAANTARPTLTRALTRSVKSPCITNSQYASRNCSRHGGPALPKREVGASEEKL